MTEMINISEGEKQRQINSAEGKAEEILAIAKATGNSISKVADALMQPGGKKAFEMQLSEQYLQNMQGLSQAKTKIILPANLLDFDKWLNTLGLNEKGLSEKIKD
jgi:regulator of protease activity HflC (stomatin/prohibitin superfamily)